MGALAKLLFATPTVATVATVATQTPIRAEVSQESRESQGVTPEIFDIRAHLHRLAADAGVPAAVVDAIDDDEVTLYDCGLSELTLRDCLRARSLNSDSHPAYRDYNKATTP